MILGKQGSINKSIYWHLNTRKWLNPTANDFCGVTLSHPDMP
ncbi:unnamed protein product [Musa acuminata subsp. burmannicoides]